jgi:hypothetical protein
VVVVVLVLVVLLLVGVAGLRTLRFRFIHLAHHPSTQPPQISEKIRDIEAEGGDVDFSRVAPYAAGVRTKKMWQESGDTEDAMVGETEPACSLSRLPIIP